MVSEAGLDVESFFAACVLYEQFVYKNVAPCNSSVRQQPVPKLIGLNFPPKLRNCAMAPKGRWTVLKYIKGVVDYSTSLSRWGRRAHYHRLKANSPASARLLLMHVPWLLDDPPLPAVIVAKDRPRRCPHSQRSSSQRTITTMWRPASSQGDARVMLVNDVPQ